MTPSLDLSERERKTMKVGDCLMLSEPNSLMVLYAQCNAVYRASIYEPQGALDAKFIQDGIDHKPNTWWRVTGETP